MSIRENRDHNVVLLAGSGRSGTTWLGNILAANPNVAVIFEPFDPRRVDEARPFPLRPYARPDGQYAEWEAVVGKILAGQVKNEWTQQQGNRWWANRRLIKTIRANLMLSWISRRFKPTIVFMTRHPCAVVLSRLKLGWETHLDVFLDQPQLIEDHLTPFVDLIAGARTEIEKHTIMWCVENLVPIRQAPEHDWIFCTYETLYERPQVETERILQQVDVRPTWLTKRAIERRSMVTRSDSALASGRNPLLEWQRKLTKEQIYTILTIVETFNIGLYGSEPMPAPQVLARIQKKLTHAPTVCH